MTVTVQTPIRINKEGVWYYENNEIFRKDIALQFYNALKLDDTGRYVIEIDNEKCYVEVEDAPFVVKSIRFEHHDEIRDDKDVIHLYLSDGTSEPLNPDTLRISDDNILYCLIKNAEFKARFSRASYYHFAEYVEYNAKKDFYFIQLNGQCHSIQKDV